MFDHLELDELVHSVAMGYIVEDYTLAYDYDEDDFNSIDWWEEA